MTTMPPRCGSIVPSLCVYLWDVPDIGLYSVPARYPTTFYYPVPVYVSVPESQETG